MNKYDTILDSNELILHSDDSSFDDQIIYMTPEEFKLNQLDEHYNFQSDLYDFLKNYMDSKQYIFPIMNHFNYTNFCNFIEKFIIPTKLK